MDKVAELCAAEQKYIDKLRLVSRTYRRLVTEADDPEVESDVGLYQFPGLLTQHRQIFKFYERMLELHQDLHEFWTRAGEDFLSVDRCGQLFYRCLSEDRYDIYLEHATSNPLRHGAIQRDFTGFLEVALEFGTNDIDADGEEEEELPLLLTGYECFRFPLDHVQFFGRTLIDLTESFAMETSSYNSNCYFHLSSAANLMRKLLNRIEEVRKVTPLITEVLLPQLGIYHMCTEFIAREYKEGQQHKVKLYLFDKGVVVLTMTRSGFAFLKREPVFELDSFCAMDQIELDRPANCFRLKEEFSKLTYYKIQERKEFLKRDTTSMIEFIDKIEKIKWIFKQPVVKLSELNCDVAGQEAMNYKLIRSRCNSTGLTISAGIINFLDIRPTFSNTISCVETVNIPLCEKFIQNRHIDDDHKIKKINYWKRLNRIDVIRRNVAYHNGFGNKTA